MEPITYVSHMQSALTMSCEADGCKQVVHTEILNFHFANPKEFGLAIESLNPSQQANKTHWLLESKAVLHPLSRFPTSRPQRDY